MGVVATVRRTVGWLALTAVLWFVLGPTGIALGVVVVAADVASVGPRWLIGGAVALLACVPVAILAYGLPAVGTIGPAFASGHAVADHLTQGGIGLLVVGTLRDVMRARTGGTEPAHPEGAGRAAEPFLDGPTEQLPPWPRRS